MNKQGKEMLSFHVGLTVLGLFESKVQEFDAANNLIPYLILLHLPSEIHG